MATEYNPRGQCIGKVPYYSRRAAKAAVKRDEQRLGVRLRQYLCPWCGHRHLGNRIDPANWSTGAGTVNAPGVVASDPGADQPERS